MAPRKPRQVRLRTIVLLAALSGAASAQPVASAAAPSTYVTRESDNLWWLSERLGRPANRSPQQWMLATLRRNPQAFLFGNIHRLHTGVTLSLPSEAEVAAESQAAAEQVIELHREAVLRQSPMPALPATLGGATPSPALAAAAPATPAAPAADASSRAAASSTARPIEPAAAPAPAAAASATTATTATTATAATAAATAASAAEGGRMLPSADAAGAAGPGVAVPLAGAGTGPTPAPAAASTAAASAAVAASGVAVAASGAATGASVADAGAAVASAALPASPLGSDPAARRDAGAAAALPTDVRSDGRFHGAPLAVAAAAALLLAGAVAYIHRRARQRGQDFAETALTLFQDTIQLVRRQKRKADISTAAADMARSMEKLDHTDELVRPSTGRAGDMTHGRANDDDATMRLSMARAQIELGRDAAALASLRIVMRHGSESQQREARQLMAGLQKAA